jgi:histidine triad (HIT) family protein
MGNGDSYMKEDSVFTKIIRGELPAHKVYEDDLTIAFMPLHPTALGHVLVVPKLQVEQFYELPATDYEALMITVQKVAIRMNEVLQPFRVGLKIEGLDVPHAHVHVLAFDNHTQYTEGVTGESSPSDDEELAELAKKLAF